MNPQSIGVFDSGLGGLTAVRQLRRLMPSENIIYFGDTARVPYGNRSRDTLLQYARQDMRFLNTFDLKAVVIACGTVSTNCLEELRSENPVPVIGVVEPAVERAAALTKSGRVGLVATRASVTSGAYERVFHRLYPALEIFPLACPLFVPLVEEGRCRPGDIVIETVAEEYLSALRDAGVDTLVLGCTHYPLLSEVIGGVMGPDVALVDVGAEAARACQDLLAARDALADRREGSARFYTSDRAVNFQRLAALFLGEEGPVEQVDISRY
ncbi:MAG: glutamate racemase [Oscillibacter sp.]|nr:glutamate racemase [Oscillibacter sp.]